MSQCELHQHPTEWDPPKNLPASTTPAHTQSLPTVVSESPWSPPQFLRALPLASASQLLTLLSTAGFPVTLQSKGQLCHFVTMCIFTCTGQHSSTHLGQVLITEGQLSICAWSGEGATCRQAKGFSCLADSEFRYLPFVAGLVRLGP